MSRPPTKWGNRAKTQHLLEVARALRIQANLPLSFLGECILTLPSPNLDGKSPYGMLFECPPSYDHLRIFYCLCYAHTLRVHRHKFAPRGSKCIFVGYPFGQCGCRVYDLEKKCIFTSRDVMFIEATFAFKTNSPNLHTSIDPRPVIPMPVLD